MKFIKLLLIAFVLFTIVSALLKHLPEFSETNQIIEEVSKATDLHTPMPKKFALQTLVGDSLFVALKAKALLYKDGGMYLLKIRAVQLNHSAYYNVLELTSVLDPTGMLPKAALVHKMQEDSLACTVLQQKVYLAVDAQNRSPELVFSQFPSIKLKFNSVNAVKGSLSGSFAGPAQQPNDTATIYLSNGEFTRLPLELKL